MYAVNDAKMKYLFDNRYGTGQSVWDGIMRSTNLLIAGKNVLVAGYGWCGRGIAMRARGLGARVLVCEVDPVRAVEAVMDGFSLGPMEKMIEQADFLITATGCRDVVTEGAFARAKDGLVMANAGHFDVEIDKLVLSTLATEQTDVRDGIRQFKLGDGRQLYLLGDGRLVTLVLGDGHPVEIMDISFALQALTLKHIVESGLHSPAVYRVPDEIDQQVAEMKLAALDVRIDSLTPEQSAYLGL
jgi:adenosylhomocysteinase